jgi:TIR domain
MTNRRVFISHAVKDKELADMLVDLFTSSSLLLTSEIFCTSLEGLGVPSGKDFLDVIKGELQNSDLVISLISVNYLQSQFCLCELGATWAMSHDNLPILVPPLTYSDLSEVISAQQTITLNDRSELNNMMNRIVKILGKEPIISSRWEKKRDDFIAKFNKELAVLYESIAPREAAVISETGNTKVDDYLEIREAYLAAKNSLEKQDTILMLLSDEPDFRMQLPGIAAALKIKEVTCQYHINFLLERGVVDHVEVYAFMRLQVSWDYQLNKAGVRYLVENGKVLS